MQLLSPVTRRRLAMQGVERLDDPATAAAARGLRVAPGLCAAAAAAGVVMQAPVVIAALVPFAVAGAAGAKHPFDVVYDHGVRHLTGTGPVPRYGQPRRFACALAAAWLGATAAVLAAGAATAGTLLGSVFVAVAAVPALTDFCIPSWLYGLLLRPAEPGDPVAAGFGDLARELAPRPALSPAARPQPAARDLAAA